MRNVNIGRGFRFSFLFVGVWMALAGCTSMPGRSDSSAARASDRAGATLQAKSGSQVSGTVEFIQLSPEMMQINVRASGLKPDSDHGFHIHEKGDCSAADGASAGGHFNPTSNQHGYHGGPQYHVGDLPNLRADDQGLIDVSFEIDRMMVGGPNGLTGRSVVIHRDPDDYKSQPAGNSGPRIACGVIVAG